MATIDELKNEANKYKQIKLKKIEDHLSELILKNLELGRDQTTIYSRLCELNSEIKFQLPSYQEYSKDELKQVLKNMEISDYDFKYKLETKITKERIFFYTKKTIQYNILTINH